MKKVNKNIYKEIRPSYSLSAFLFTPLYIIVPLDVLTASSRTPKNVCVGGYYTLGFCKLTPCFLLLQHGRSFGSFAILYAYRNSWPRRSKKSNVNSRPTPRTRIRIWVLRSGPFNFWGGRGNGGFQNEVCVVTKIRKTWCRCSCIVVKENCSHSYHWFIAVALANKEWNCFCSNQLGLATS